MARGRRSSQRMRSGQRDTSAIANAYSPLLSQLNLVEDRRYYHPEDEDRPALNVMGRPARFAVSSVVRPPMVRVHRRPFVARDYYTNSFRGFQFPVGVKFQSMFPVITCLRRKIRKEVLFALNRRNGRGGRRRNWRSDVRC